jgi:hypothetical protein
MEIKNYLIYGQNYFYNNNTDYVDKDVDVEDIKLLGKLVSMHLLVLKI